jgi:hypothetical protein
MAAGAMGAASASWVESLSAFARAQAHTGATQTAQAATEWTPRVLTTWQNEAVTALAELIIPATGTPGAKAARVNRFIDQVLGDAPPSERDAFFVGLAWMDRRSKALFGKDLVAASASEQTDLLTRLSAAQPDHADRQGAEFFRVLKSMTISGYYSSEIGLRQELGDDGQLFHLEFKGCDHPEHQ